jgi:anti-repressor protein
MKNPLIKIEINENQQQVVSAKELHRGLGINKDFTSWFKQQTERLNLQEERDFTPFRVESTGGRPGADFIVTIDIAKHICMVSGGEKAWQIRDYFITVEKAWNTPEAIMARALKMADTKLVEYKNNILQLETKIEEQKPKVIFAETLETSDSSILVGELAKLLARNGVKGMGQNRLFKWLRDNSYLHKTGEQYNLPTQYSIDLGLIEVKTRTINNPNGSVRVTKTPKITGKGQIYFVNKLRTNEELPIVEQKEKEVV